MGCDRVLAGHAFTIVTCIVDLEPSKTAAVARMQGVTHLSKLLVKKLSCNALYLSLGTAHDTETSITG